MPSEVLDPKISQQKDAASSTATYEGRHSDKDEDTLVKEAIGRAADSSNANEPLMTQLCRISAEVDKAKKQAKAKRENSEAQEDCGKATQIREGQAADPRNRHEVLISEGIEPHPGPRQKANETKRKSQQAKPCPGFVFAWILLTSFNVTEARHSTQRVPTLQSDLFAVGQGSEDQLRNATQTIVGEAEDLKQNADDKENSACLVAVGPSWDDSAGTTESENTYRYLNTERRKRQKGGLEAAGSKQQDQKGKRGQ